MASLYDTTDTLLSLLAALPAIVQAALLIFAGLCLLAFLALLGITWLMCGVLESEDLPDASAALKAAERERDSYAKPLFNPWSH